MTRDMLTIAVPKGRLLNACLPLLEHVGLAPEEGFFDDKDRRLIFASANPNVRIVPVKAFDVATFVAVGGADLGIVGSDVIEEFDYPEIYRPVDLKVGQCRLALATDKDHPHLNQPRGKRLLIATKYPNVTKRFYSAQGIQTECIKLNGAIELAPKLGFADWIVDIVTTGNTLKANGLVEVEKLIDISARLIVNRTASKVRAATLDPMIANIRAASDAA